MCERQTETDVYPGSRQLTLFLYNLWRAKLFGGRVKTGFIGFGDFHTFRVLKSLTIVSLRIIVSF